MDNTKVLPLIGVAQAAAASASKSGFKSSEFWGHILGALPLLAACLGGPAAPILLAAGAVAQLGASVYTSARAKAKIDGLAMATAVAKAASAQLPPAELGK